ncbi:hypothetical protein ASF10_22110 [Flavobacterium sp. Leaf82]|jgi:hypothetical protein|uniref:hypothetical protein n=1 Tax=Flavobacterium sp. Leaf82 TaxID=1736238 RepID=UPI0006F36B43|nr:hypothetical protein [Flavobacterium sp. Leaf82]KQO31334.1 hypothetical protein ASF10_22110 [Flavobacterium sp. Leaf82]
MNSLDIKDFPVEQSIVQKGMVIYEVNKYLILFGVKTSIYFGNSAEVISINNINLSQNASMKLSYLLGSLNFFNDFLCSRILLDDINIEFLMKNLKILTVLINLLEHENNVNVLENIIDEMNNQRIELRNIYMQL